MPYHGIHGGERPASWHGVVLGLWLLSKKPNLAVASPVDGLIVPAGIEEEVVVKRTRLGGRRPFRFGGPKRGPRSGSDRLSRRLDAGHSEGRC